MRGTSVFPAITPFYHLLFPGGQGLPNKYVLIGDLSRSLACSQGKLPSVIKLMNDYIFIYCSRTEMTNRWNANVTADMRICVLKFKECMVLRVIRTRRMDPIPHTNTSERKTFGVMRTKFTRPQSSHSHVCDCCSHPRTSQVEEYSRT